MAIVVEGGEDGSQSSNWKLKQNSRFLSLLSQQVKNIFDFCPTFRRWSKSLIHCCTRWWKLQRPFVIYLLTYEYAPYQLLK